MSQEQSQLDTFKDKVESILDGTETLPTSPYAPKDIPLELLIRLRKKNLSYDQVAKLAGCSKANAIQRLKDVEGLETWKEERSDVLAYKQKKCLEYLTDDKLKKAPPGTLSLVFSQLYDKERLERNLSTNNIAYQDVSSNISDINKEIAQLEGKVEDTHEVIDVPGGPGTQGGEDGDE